MEVTVAAFAAVFCRRIRRSRDTPEQGCYYPFTTTDVAYFVWPLRQLSYSAPDLMLRSRWDETKDL